MSLDHGHRTEARTFPEASAHDRDTAGLPVDRFRRELQQHGSLEVFTRAMMTMGRV